MRSRVVAPVALAAVLVLFWWMATSTSPRVGATADERLHLVGGYTLSGVGGTQILRSNGTLGSEVTGTVPGTA